MAVDWTRGYRATWRIVRLDDTWAPVGALRGVDSASVNRTRGGLLEEAALSVSMPLGQEPEPGWHRIEMTATQGASSELVQVATLWLEPDGSTIARGAGQWTLTGQSAVAPAQWPGSELPDGSYARKNSDGAAEVVRLISRRTPAPVMAMGSFPLRDAVVYDLSSTELDAAWQVLEAGGWCMQVDGDGTVHVMPMPTEPVRRINLAALGATMTYETDDSGVRRRCWSYAREWWPGIHPYSLLEAVTAPGEPARLMRVDTQALTLGRGIVVQETAVELEAA